MSREAIILAGGLGTRLRSVVSDRPKVLAPVAGRPFVTYLLDQLQAADFEHVVFSTGYCADLVRNTLGPAYGSVALSYVAEEKPVGTGGGVRLASGITTGDPLVILNGDSSCEVDFEALSGFHSSHAARATLALAYVPDTSRFGQVTLGPGSEIRRFEEKRQHAEPGWINAGIYCLTREAIAQIPPGRAFSIERELFPALTNGGLYGFQTSGRFLDIGTPDTYHAAEAFILGRI